MTASTAALPSGKRLQYWSNELWLLLGDARRQNQEVLALAHNIKNKTRVAEALRENASQALIERDETGARLALRDLGIILADISRDAKRLDDIEQRDVTIEATFRNLLSIIERTIQRCLKSK